MSSIFLLSALFCLGFCACGAKTPTPAPTVSGDQTDTEQQAVYTAALQNLYGNSNYVIMNTTATDPDGVGNTSQTLDFVLQNMHAVSTETAESFRLRNDAAYAVPADMELGVPYTLLSQENRNLIFSPNQSGWEIFYGQYPDAPGITSLSRVGFNNTLDQALVYIGTQRNWLSGAGYYLLLNKVDGKWTIDQQVMTWIS
jgi:hypothetical protein